MPVIVDPSPEAIARAAAALRSGQLVAFPTETVYGLGADARNPDAVAAIFRAKGRPVDHPVIVHLGGAEAVDAWARRVPHDARALAAAFWPGPLTLILPARDEVSRRVTGGQDTVGLRVPSHPVALELLRAAGDGVAAPSANRFGRISPTRALDVAEELGDRVALILDGGPTEVGLESTILDLSGPAPRLLRPGAISAAAIEEVLGRPPQAAGAGAPRAPGRLDRHYAPGTPTYLVESDRLASRVRTSSAGLGVVARQPEPLGFAGSWRQLPHHPDAYGRRLYATLRDLDAAGLERILIEAVPPSAPWAAVGDRLRRAAEPEPVEVPGG